MENKKQGKIWLLAIIHFLIGGLIIPSIIGYLLNIFIASPLKFVIYFGSLSGSLIEIVYPTIFVLIKLISLLIGVYCSALFIRDRYFITESKSLIKWATILYALFGFLALFFYGPFYSEIIILIIITIFYYFSSKKFIIKNI